MYITDLFPLEDLNKMVEEGYVNVQTHPTLPLSIYDYSKNCMYARMWNEVTENCRGLIVENFTGKVVARGPRKFYNYGQPEAVEYPLNTHVRVTRKEDGSLGIPWFYDGQYGVATRGSFQSDQAKHATEMINSDEYKWLREDILTWGVGIYSPIVEIIYPSNRIVLNYRGLDALISLGCVDMEGTIQIRKLDESTNWMTLEEAITLPIPDDEEGYVLDIELMEGVIRDHLKLKGETYMMFHSILTETSGRRIWNQMASRACHQYILERKHWGTYLGADPDDMEKVNVEVDLMESLSDAPDEFLGWVEAKVSEIDRKVQDFYDESVELSKEISQYEGLERYQKFGHIPQYVEITRYLQGRTEFLLFRSWKEAYPDGKDLPFLTDED